MIDEIINRIKDLYHQLEYDEARHGRKLTENLKFGVSPPPVLGAPPVTGPMGGPSPPSMGEVPAAAPPVQESLLDQIGRSRGNL